ncbi:hypothetical protein FH966_01930 [Lentibacillus cibarius]|uniref:Uncharacterized protein n=1 Tax=Lentibacillus cibarius TaxID=2583219 RepID=A0A549YFF0_9BACI|nr:hypothetical protein [Lentibacillus cibarius]TRM10577.1 hypothetical protein FH966_01930 [Lentibacillus cibarius]
MPLEKDISWSFYNEHVRRLREDYELSVGEIAERVNCDPSKIDNYSLDERIPSHIRKKTIKMNSRTTVQAICRNKIIPETMKLILYEKAILDKHDPLRLSGEKLKYVKMLCEKNHIPASLLYNELRLEQFINELLSNNFNLNGYFKTLVPPYHHVNEWSILLSKYGITSREWGNSWDSIYLN